MLLEIKDLPPDTAPTSDDLILTVNDPSGSPANKKVTIGNLFRNVPDGDVDDPGLAFGSNPLMGFYYEPGDPTVIYGGYDGFNSMRFGLADGHLDFFATVAETGGWGRIGFNADELAITILDDGTIHQNRDIMIYSLGNVGIRLQPDLIAAGYGKTVGCFKVVDQWVTPLYEYATVTVPTGYPNTDSGGDWPTIFFTPNYSRLTGVEDGYAILHARPTPPASGASRQLFWRFEKETAAAMKSEMDIDGKLNLQGGIIGDLTISGIATGEIVCLYKSSTGTGTTWGYKAVYVNGSGTNIASAELTVSYKATLNATDYLIIGAKHVPGATSIKIYRTTAGGTPNTTGLIGTITGPDTLGKWRINDTGLAAGGETPESTNTTGKVNIQWAMAFAEVTNAPAAVANKVILFAQDNGAGKTQLMGLMPTGVAQQILIEA